MVMAPPTTGFENIHRHATKHKVENLIKKDAILKGEFTLSSGQKSDYYVKLMNVITNPLFIAHVVELIDEVILDYLKEEQPYYADDYLTGIGGVALGGVPLVYAYISRRPYFFPFIVRTDSKRHGAKSRLEKSPSMREGGQVILLDDVMTTGKSIIKAAEIMTDAGYDVIKSIVIVDREEGGIEECRQRRLEVVSLFKISSLLED